MPFCQLLKTTIYGDDIYNKFKKLFNDHKISKTNIVSFATDGVHNIINKNKGWLKLVKKDNLSKLVVHCSIHSKNLVAKNVAPKTARNIFYDQMYQFYQRQSQSKTLF